MTKTFSKNAIITVGAPCSGKSTFIREFSKGFRSIDFVHSNRDDIRDTISFNHYGAGDYSFGTHEKLVTTVEESILDHFLTNSYNEFYYINSNTNLNKHFLNELINRLLSNYINITFFTFFKTDLETLKKRNQHRFFLTSRNLIPDAAIESMYRRYSDISDYLLNMQNKNTCYINIIQGEDYYEHTNNNNWNIYN